MINYIHSFDLTTIDWISSILCGFIIGLSKAGVPGIGLMIVPVMAATFGGKASTGIVLPMLIIADIIAVRYYHRHTNWEHIIRIIPWVTVGIFIALFVGENISDDLFKDILSISVLCGIVIIIWRDIKKKIRIPNYRCFPMVLGLTGGFTTMIANAAGPVLSLYLLSMRIPKLNFIGTSAWFFLIVNVFKIPIHTFSWETISLKTITFNLITAPAIIVGVFAGIRIIKLIPEKTYRLLIIVSIIISVRFLLI